MTWHRLEETLKLQREAYGIDPPSLVGKEFAEYVRWNIVAIISELSEFLDETKWKTWTTEQGRFNDYAAIGELIDAEHFINNLLVALKCTDEEHDFRYQEKMKVNRQRQATGYDGTNKCKACGRALDDGATLCTATSCYYQAF